MLNNAPYSNRVVFLFITVLCFVLYGNTLQNGYSLDDAWAFQTKGESGLLTGIEKSFTTRLVTVGELDYGYRPITSVVFEIEQAIFGQNPFVSHFINVFLYALICHLLFLWLAKHLALEWWKAIFAALIFIILPIHSEVVDSVKNRDELLSAFFGLLYVIYAWKYYKNGNIFSLILGFVFFTFSLLSKQNTIPLIAIVPIGLWLFETINTKRLILLVTLSLFVIFFTQKALWRIVELSVVNQIHELVESPLYGSHTMIDRITVATNSLGFYCTGVFGLNEFVSYYGYKTLDFTLANTKFFIGAILFIITGLTFLFFSFKSKKFRMPLFGLLFFTGAIFPFLNLLQIMPGVVGERLTFFASMGLALFMAWALWETILYLKSTGKKSVVIVLGITMGLTFIAWSYKLVKRNSDWFSLETLVVKDLKKYPENVLLNMIMGSIEFNKGHKKENDILEVIDIEKVRNGYSYFYRANQTFDQHATAIYNMAWIDTYILSENIDEAEEKWWRLVELNAIDTVDILPHLVNILERKNQVNDAILLCVEYCEKGNENMGLLGMRLTVSNSDWQRTWRLSKCLYPKEGLRLAKLKEVWSRLNEVDSAKSNSFMNSLLSSDESSYFRKIKAKDQMEQGLFKESISTLESINPKYKNDPEVFLLYGNIHMSLNKQERAIEYFQAAYEIDTTNVKLKAYLQTLIN